MNWRLFGLMAAMCVALAGCGDSKTETVGPVDTAKSPKATDERKIAGEWEGKDNNGLPMVLTFTEGGEISMDVANPDGHLILEGTYTATANSLEMTLTKGRMEDMPEEKKILLPQLEKQLNDSLPQKSTVELRWDDNDTLTLIAKNSPPNTVKRRK